MEQPAERTPAPGGLGLLQAFVNSVELDVGQDELADVDSATAWVSSRTEQAIQLDDEQRRRLIDVREALRAVLTGHAGEPSDAVAAGRLTGMLTGAVLRPVVTADGGRLVAAGEGVDRFLAELGSAIVEATVAGTWERLKVCRDDTCLWAFYDHSKNGRGAWCSMRSCGNRAKARAYRERHRADATQLRQVIDGAVGD